MNTWKTSVARQESMCHENFILIVFLSFCISFDIGSRQALFPEVSRPAQLHFHKLHSQEEVQLESSQPYALSSQSVYPSVNQSFYLSIYSFIHMYIYVYIPVCIFLSIHPSLYLYLSSAVYATLYPIIYTLPTSLSFH